jgi:bifunctional non-homologous end joining protein LigD
VPTRRSKAQPRTLPRVEPIIPEVRGLPFDHPDWVFEPKYDGFRGLLHVTATTATFHSKRGRILTRFATLAEEVCDQLRVRNAILDGEVLAVNTEGHADFRLLRRGQGQLHYAAFDLMWLNGSDLRDLPLVIRMRRLERLIPEPTPVLSKVLTVAADGRALFEAAQRLDLEGIVAKRKADPYDPPTVTWLKIKNKAYTQMEGRGDLFHGSR